MHGKYLQYTSVLTKRMNNYLNTESFAIQKCAEHSEYLNSKMFLSTWHCWLVSWANSTELTPYFYRSDISDREDSSSTLDTKISSCCEQTQLVSQTATQTVDHIHNLFIYIDRSSLRPWTAKLEAPRQKAQWNPWRLNKAWSSSCWYSLSNAPLPKWGV